MGRPRTGADGVPSVADIVGVPVLPPGRVTPVFERFRAAVGGWQRAITPAPVQVLEGIFSLLDGVALGALCALDVPEHLDRRMDVATLARRVDANVALVDRLTRYGCVRGWLVIDRRGRLKPNRTTRFLRVDHPGGWRAWVEFHRGAEVLGALTALATDPRAGDPFQVANGASFFDWYPDHPERHAVFDAAMSAGGRLHGIALAGAVDWSPYLRVCDVGGGSGAVLDTVLAQHHHLEGLLFDLPGVVARAAPSPRREVIGGDMFTEVPAGCDVYLLVNVLHDWDDERAARILDQVASAGPEARVVVVEGERSARPVDGVTARTDLLMLALAPGGRERSTEELAALAGRAGLRIERTVHLASGDRAHLLGR